MGDNAEFEKLTVLEARLAAALDRIAVGVGEAPEPQAPLEDPGWTSGALEDTQARAEAAEARVAEFEAYAADLESQLEAARAAPQDGADDSESVAALEAERDGLQQHVAALESARQADQDEAQRALAEKDKLAETLRGQLMILTDQMRAQMVQVAEAKKNSAPPDTNALEDLRDQVADLTTRVHRLRTERNEARAVLERLQAESGSGGDEGDVQMQFEALRAEAYALREANERATETIAQLRAAHGADAEVLNAAMVVELDALRAARASEAAELERILIGFEAADAAPEAAGGDHA